MHLRLGSRVADGHDVGRVPRREHHRRADGRRDHVVTGDRVAHGRPSVHAGHAHPGPGVLHDRRAGDRGLLRDDFAGVDAGDVVDAGAAPVPVHGAEADEVLLRVAGHLRRRPGDDEVARDAPPVALAELVQPQQKQPAQPSYAMPFNQSDAINATT